jgi:2-oxoglutarate dehydrogenase E2 component (dihydrolipoamide succinyltransferase)
MLTTFNEIDMSGILALREKYKESFESKHAVKLGFMSIFTKAAANALLQFPDVNGYYKEAEGVIQYNDYVDVGIAVATPTGLVLSLLHRYLSSLFCSQ